MKNILDINDDGNTGKDIKKNIGDIIRNEFDVTTLENLGNAHFKANNKIFNTHNNIELSIIEIFKLINDLQKPNNKKEKNEIITNIIKELNKIYENNLIGYETYCSIETLTIKELGRLGVKIKETKFDKDTGLKTRHYFLEEFEKFFNEKRNFSLIILDLNNLKQVNDNYGHKKGDKLLEEFAIGINDEQIFGGGINEIYRIGGDEFVIIYFGDKNEIENIIDKLRKWFYKRRFKIMYNGDTIEHEITFGIGITNTDYELYKTNNELFEKADIELYKDKTREKIRNILKNHEKPKEIIEFLEKIRNKKIEYQNKIFDILFISLKRIERALLNLYLKEEEKIKENDEIYKKFIIEDKTKAKNYLEDKLKEYTLGNIDKIIQEKRIVKVLNKFSDVKE